MLVFLAQFRLASVAGILLALLAYTVPLRAQTAYVRVNQIGYEVGATPFRAYLMSSAAVSGVKFKVVNSKGVTAFSGDAGALLGTWGHSKTVNYDVYALDFKVPGGDLYTISVSGAVSATSPHFAVDNTETLYSGLLLNTLFFYETERDGANFIPNALRTAPGHLKDKNARVYETPPLDSNDFIDNVPPAPPLVSAQLPNIDADGGWWDAGDYMKYVETVSYTAALMEIGIRDFPNQMGADAPVNPPAPPGSVSYAGNSGPGAPASSDFTGEAMFGISWLMKMWDDKTQTLYYQVDNSQDWDYYGEGNPSSATGNCGGTYETPYCLITEYDIWTLPQAADNYKEPGDPQPCDPYTTFFICRRPLYVAGPAGSPISPNLAGRLAADFALCYQLNRTSNPSLAKQCLKNAEDIFALADTSYPDPAPTVGSGTCATCLLTITPFDGYPENVWEDDMELGATELYFALAIRAGSARLDDKRLAVGAAGYESHGLPAAGGAICQWLHHEHLRHRKHRYAEFVRCEWAGTFRTVSGSENGGKSGRLVCFAGEHSQTIAATGWRRDPSSRQRSLGLRLSMELWRYYFAWRRFVGYGQRGSLPDAVEELRHLCAEMAGQYSGRQLLGLVVHRGRRKHVSQLHPAPGSESGRRAGWDFRWDAGALGCGYRGSSRVRHIGPGRGHDSVSSKRRRHVQAIQWKHGRLSRVATGGVSGQHAVLQHH